MGFFSSIKKLFGSAEPAPDARTEHPGDLTAEETTPPIVSAEAPAMEKPATESAPAEAASEPTPQASTSPEISKIPEASTESAHLIDSTPTGTADVTPHAGGVSDEHDALTLRLRAAEPRLSAWMTIALEGIDEASPRLWERVAFLLRALGAPDGEIDAFIDDVSDWVARMEYDRVDDFRSELQYRLALALELEDEEDERDRLFIKLQHGLARTRAQFGKSLNTLFASHGALTPAFWEELEEVFIMADMGVEAATLLCGRLKTRAREAGVTTPSDLSPLLGAELENIFRIPRRVVAVNPPEIVLMIGVNGVGKTTTIAKLAYRSRSQGKKVMLAAGDTFRAAAVEQLGIWAQRTGSLFHSKGQDADPSAVAWEAVDKALEEQVDVLFIDTAGRLHTKTNLMEELKKVRATVAKKHPGAPHRTVLILDATTGQNALSQVKLFNEAVGIDEIVLTKLDGTAKGGVAVAVALQFRIPITFVGLGEKMEDLRPFDGDDFARALLEHTTED